MHSTLWSHTFEKSQTKVLSVTVTRMLKYNLHNARQIIYFSDN